MKKIILITMIALIAAGMIGCKEDFEATVKWQNDSTVADVKDIQWVSISNSPNQTWNETVTKLGGADNLSEPKTVTLETGKGLCFDDATGGLEYEIEINGGSITYVLNDGETETLRITDLNTLVK